MAPGTRHPPSSLSALRINGVQKLVASIQGQISAWVREQRPVSDVELGQFSKRISLQVESWIKTLHAHGATERNLTPKSASALRWLIFLMDPEKIRLHFHAQSAAFQFARDLSRKKQGILFWKAPRVQVEFYASGYLYRGKTSPNGVQILIHEAFIGAPDVILEDVVFLAMEGRDKKRLEAVRQYTRKPEFRKTFALLDVRSRKIRGPQGKFIHLHEVFQRINLQYFENQLDEPRLDWGSRKSRRRFGFYLEDTDTIVINPVLDSLDIPGYVIDFVMYHELLHKKMGVIHKNGRRRYHTALFRAAEKDFRDYEKAQNMLKQISQSM